MPDLREKMVREAGATRSAFESDLQTTSPFRLRTADGEENDGRTIDGFALVFKRLATIDSWEGRFREQLAPRSTHKSITERVPKLQFDHGRHPLIGSIPIGMWRHVAEESDPELAPTGGMRTVGRLHDNWLIEPVRDAIRTGAIDGMSFRFEVVSEQWHTAAGKEIRDRDTLRRELERAVLDNLPEDELPIRTLREVKVSEAGPVVWPAYEDTSVGVRSRQVIIDLGRLRDPEQRRRLADAVFRADVIEGEGDEPPPDARTLPAPQPTDDESAGEHADENSTTGTPQVTSIEADEHAPPAPRSRDPLREAVESQRAYVAQIKKEAARWGLS